MRVFTTSVTDGWAARTASSRSSTSRRRWSHRRDSSSAGSVTCERTSSATPSSSRSLSSKCQYSAIGVTPRWVASRRIVTASMPSASAMARARSATVSRLSRSFVPTLTTIRRTCLPVPRTHTAYRYSVDGDVMAFPDTRARNPWATLTVLALAQFMVVLDVTIVNVALPNMQASLHFSPDDLQWVISAYTLAFGGFLLLGGRLSDLLGRRRIFSAGLGLFTVASLAGGLASSQGMLIGVRAVQGFGGALMSAAALSILTVTFAHGRQRNIAMGIWGGLAGLGGTLGVVAGGILVDALGWEWVFFVNVPIGVLLLALTPVYVPASRVAATGHPSGSTFDIAGSVLGTTGVLAVIFAVIRAEPLGWGSFEVIGSLALGAALLAGFVAVEARSADPLVPLR